MRTARRLRGGGRFTLASYTVVVILLQHQALSCLHRMFLSHLRIPHPLAPPPLPTYLPPGRVYRQQPAVGRMPGGNSGGGHPPAWRQEEMAVQAEAAAAAAAAATATGRILSSGRRPTGAFVSCSQVCVDHFLVLFLEFVCWPCNCFRTTHLLCSQSERSRSVYAHSRGVVGFFLVVNVVSFQHHAPLYCNIA